MLPGFLHIGYLGYYTAPVITVPANMTVEATGSNGATVSFVTTAKDNVNGAISTTNTPASESFFPIGATTVTTTASDAVGNSASSTFNVTVVVPPVAASEKTAPFAALSGSALSLTVRGTIPGRTYQLQHSDTLLEGSWINIGAVQTGGGNDLILSSPCDPTVTKRFYRLLLGP